MSKITCYKDSNNFIHENKLDFTIAELKISLDKKLTAKEYDLNVLDPADLTFLSECGKLASEIIRLQERATAPVKQKPTIPSSEAGL